MACASTCVACCARLQLCLSAEAPITVENRMNTVQPCLTRAVAMKIPPAAGWMPGLLHAEHDLHKWPAPRCHCCSVQLRIRRISVKCSLG
ncbi:hypothetical protein COO60DRAFT_1477271 [Scenedesmus sp. NREL 46B-D3]|nr:hypothetical protein COO60DRAFT_1477271 [Scenedesmus sp. NREL 46B-D3]